MANFFAAAIIFGLFVLSAVVSAERKDITQGFDEMAQASYVAHIQHSHDAWPAFDTLRMLDPKTFKFTGEANYLDHPPYSMRCSRCWDPNWRGTRKQ